jgi:hypothetical protein
VDSSVLGGEDLVFLVFDESDALALPNIRRSDAWKAAAMSSLRATGFDGPWNMADEAHHLFSHYYVVHVGD